MHLAYQIFSSPIGEVLVAGTDYAITHVKCGKSKIQLGSDFLCEHDNATSVGRNDYVKDACNTILNYLQGRHSRIDVAVQADGTEFQRKVWQMLRQIPYGKTVSYSEVAEEIGSPDAFRAVANACSDNPIPLIIPCHRVIHKNGEISGFALGDDVKRYLLSLEESRVNAGALA